MRATCLLLGATLIFGAPQEPQPFRGLEVRRSWPSLGFHPRRIQQTGEWLRDEIDSEKFGKSERLTAVAAAEYAGTRAVAYAGINHHHHHHQQHHQGYQTREIFQQGVTAAPNTAGGTYTKHHSG